MDTSDRSLLAAVRDHGDSSAYAELYRRHVDAARGAAWKIAPHLDGDDLVAESFARILQALKNGAGPTESFRPYLYQTIRRLSLEFAAPFTLSDIADQDQLVDPASLEDPGEAIDRRDLIAAALAGMPERWREVLWYTEVEGYTAREAMPILGLTAANIAQIRSRALRRLRRNLGPNAASFPSRPGTAMAHVIAVAMLGASTAAAVLPHVESQAAVAHASDSAPLVDSAPTSPKLLLGKGLVVSGGVATAIIAGVLLLWSPPGADVNRASETQDGNGRSSEVQAGEAEQGSSRPSSLGSERPPSGTAASTENTTARSGGDGLGRGLSDPGLWLRLPQQDPVIRGPVG